MPQAGAVWAGCDSYSTLRSELGGDARLGEEELLRRCLLQTPRKRKTRHSSNPPMECHVGWVMDSREHRPRTASIRCGGAGGCVL